jgi:hypothetical protein
MEAICSSETSVDVQRTTQRYILEDGAIHLQKPSSSYTEIGPTQSLYLQRITQDAKKRGNSLSIPEMDSNPRPRDSTCRKQYEQEKQAIVIGQCETEINKTA